MIMASNAPTIFDRMSALSDTTRSRLLLVLEEHELTVSELCAVLQLPQSPGSRPLQRLADGRARGARAARAARAAQRGGARPPRPAAPPVARAARRGSSRDGSCRTGMGPAGPTGGSPAG